MTRKKKTQISREENKFSTSITQVERAGLSLLVDKKGGFAACLNCGGTMIDNRSCIDCGHVGGSIKFKDVSAYERFLRRKRQAYNMKLDQDEADLFLAKPYADGGRKNPFVAMFISLLLPGAGQVYIGHLRKAWAVLILAFIAYSSLSFLLLYRSLIPENIDWVMYTPFIILYMIMIIASMDAYFSAGKVRLNKDE